MSEIVTSLPVARIMDLHPDVFKALAGIDKPPTSFRTLEARQRLADDLPTALNNYEVAELGIKVRFARPPELDARPSGLKGEIAAIKWLGINAINSDIKTGMVTFESCLNRLEALKQEAPIRASIAKLALRRQLSEVYNSSIGDTKANLTAIGFADQTPDDADLLFASRLANQKLAEHLASKYRAGNLQSATLDVKRRELEMTADKAMENLVNAR